MSLPQQSVTYVGPITDTGRWENFKYRPDDVFICTPPKCGTTWSQAICAMLVFGTPEHGQKPGMISPWIDANFAPIDEYLEMVEAQDHRRFIKTHSPLDGIPYYPECQYLVVCRDPRDMYFSMINHRDNMSDEDLAHMVMPSGDSPFESWVNGTLDPDNFDVQSLHGCIHFLKTYWDYRDVPNIHLMHYYDMKQDLRGHIARVAGIMNVELSDAQLDEMTEAATFESMQAKGDQYAPGADVGLWKQNSGFFATGKNAQWKGKLTEEQLAAFDTKARELLTPEQYDWLLRS